MKMMTGKTKALGEKLFPLPLCPLQIPYTKCPGVESRPPRDRLAANNLNHDMAYN